MQAPRPLFALIALLFAFASPVTPAWADTTGLVLSQGDIFSDAVGSVIGVTISNNGSTPLTSAMVTCAFTAEGRPVGQASTNLYNILPGSSGQDQVHMMGARADKASCTMSTPAPPPPPN